MKHHLSSNIIVLVRAGSLICILILAGCSSTDPWGQRLNAPSDAHREFRPDRDILAPARNTTEKSVTASKVGRDKLDLAECIVIALENNPRTRSSLYDARAASNRVGERRSSYLPQAEFTSGAGRSKTADTGSVSEKKEDSRPTTAYDASFGVRQLLYDGGKRAADVSEARAKLYAANFRHNTALQDVALTVQEAYYQLLAHRWSVNVAEETLRQTKHHEELANAHYEAGMVSRSDVLKATTEHANARLQMVKARSAVRISRGELTNAMNLKVSAELEVQDIPQGSRDREIVAVEKLLEEAATERPELQAALAEVQSNQATIRAARSEYLPDVTANADYGWRGEHLAPNEEEWSVGLNLILPLFTGFERSYRLRRTNAELRRAVSDYEETLRSVALEVWTAYARVQEADEAIEAAQALAASAEESLEVARGEYKEGVGSITELIDAQTAYSDAQNQLVQARLDWYETLARLDRAVGRSLEKQALKDEKDENNHE